MSSFAGYKGTAPPQFFIANDRKELTGEAPYQDSLDLANTFISWEFGFSKASKSLGKLTLINPSTQLEDKLFSWYAAVSPRTYTAVDRNITFDKISKNVREIETFYVKWGYKDSSKAGVLIDGFSEALSHLHKFVMMDMSYQVSDRGERMITLTLVPEYDLHYGNPEFIKKERIFPFGISDSEGRLRPPSVIIQEAIGTLMTAKEGYEAVCNLSNEQLNLIDTDFLEVCKSKGIKDPSLNQKLPEVRADSYLSYQAKKDPSMVTSKPWLTLECYRDYMHKFGFTANLNSAIEQAKPAKAESLNQNKGSADQGTPWDPNTQANKTAINNAVNQKVAVCSVDVPVQDVRRVDYNPITVLAFGMGADSVPFIPGPYTLVYKKVSSEGAKYFTKLTIAQMQEILENKGYYYAVHVSLKETLEQTNDPLYLAWSNRSANPIFTPGQAEPQGIYDYPFEPGTLFEDTLAYSLRTQIRVLESRMYEDAVAELKAKNAQDSDAIIKAQAKLLEENTSGTSAVEPVNLKATVKPFDTMDFVSIDLVHDVTTMVGNMNDIFMKAAGEYLQTGLLEYANVPHEYRESTQEFLQIPVDWDNDTGVFIIGNASLMENVFRFTNIPGVFKSFPIQSKLEDGSNTVSLATGFSQRGDNIITSLNWKLKTGSVWHNLRNTPVIQQQIYNVAKRFEDEDYRDVVMALLSLNLLPQSSTARKLVTDGDAAYGIPASGLANDVDMVGTEVFPEETVSQALGQAANIADIKLSTLDSADISDAATKELIEKVRVDLRFILDSELIDVFFPKVSKENMDKVKTKVTIINPPRGTIEKDVEIFRYVTGSPLNSLQNVMRADGFDSSGNPAHAVLMQSKLRQLSIFKKLITDIRLVTLGIPEMDVWKNEIQNRNVALWVHEPRVPGTFHWITGMYTIMEFNHKLDARTGYETSFLLAPKLPQDADEITRYKLTYLQGDAS